MDVTKQELKFIDTQELHELCMDYRSAGVINAQKCYEAILNHILVLLRKQLSTNTHDGWKLVPIEPTDEMKKLGWNAYRDSNKPAPYNALTDAYKAMINAAPTHKER